MPYWVGAHTHAQPWPELRTTHGFEHAQRVLLRVMFIIRPA